MRATINGVQIGYDDFGRGPAVLFVHDYPLNRKMWRPQVQPLVDAGFRVVLVDLRGFGESSLASERVAIHTYSADIIGLLNYLGIGRAVVCGLSLGGYVLFDLLENYPQRIAGACLATSRPVSDDIQERARRNELIVALQDGAMTFQLRWYLLASRAYCFGYHVARYQNLSLVPGRQWSTDPVEGHFCISARRQGSLDR